MGKERRCKKVRRKGKGGGGGGKGGGGDNSGIDDGKRKE
jgi:hypothetical protein